ncbi:hypothetical protein N7468_005165 [Penicillium chermesinum]|uniref:Zn(2)-C6 fungal-type domain-containing protein n=1 Tax=Penicillium chermesinum TaxID=63820 RepID=A0A9W9TPF2_9EURO|nr:uncharacterized protein N7468_005165 [Penicillium chermesinum]KAJ5232209.1 hypothetical protein N7468_005165 [Penicillium chermesinum]
MEDSSENKTPSNEMDQNDQDQDQGIPKEQATPSAKHPLEPEPEQASDANEKPEKKKRRSCKDPEPDYSVMVRNQVMQDKNRTGQACDRCRMRKLKCDRAPTGCTSCSASRLPCQVTDRVTAETFTRGAAGLMQKQVEESQKVMAEKNMIISQLVEENMQLHQQNVHFQEQNMHLAQENSMLREELLQHESFFDLPDENYSGI